MTLDEAAENIGAGVVYTSAAGCEDGTIMSVTSQFVFVRYGADRWGKATHPSQLQFLAGDRT